VPFLDHIFVFKATAETTTGSFSVIEADQHRGGEPPRHVHHREDEAFYVLEGEMTFQVGDETLPAPAGSFVFLPRDLPHSFKVGGNGDARVLHFCAPPGLERFFAEWGDRPFDRPAMGAMAEQFGVEFLPDGREPAQG